MAPLLRAASVAVLIASTFASPLDICKAEGDRLAASYNAQNFLLVKDFYADTAIVIPPTADAIVTKDSLPEYFRLAYEGGTRNLSLTPFAAHLEQYDDSLHVLGTVSSTDGSFPYYMRWTLEANTWKVTTDIDIIGQMPPAREATKYTVAAASDAPANAVATTLERKFAHRYNFRDFGGLQALYADTAVLIPPSADRFIKKADLPTFFSTTYQEVGMRNVSRVPIVVNVSHDGKIMHVLGIFSSTLASGPYYVRYVQNETSASGPWQIEVDVMTVGEVSTTGNMTVRQRLHVLLILFTSSALFGILAFVTSSRFRATAAICDSRELLIA